MEDIHWINVFPGVFPKKFHMLGHARIEGDVIRHKHFRYTYDAYLFFDQDYYRLSYVTPRVYTCVDDRKFSHQHPVNIAAKGVPHPSYGREVAEQALLDSLAPLIERRAAQVQGEFRRRREDFCRKYPDLADEESLTPTESAWTAEHMYVLLEKLVPRIYQHYFFRLH